MAEKKSFLLYTSYLDNVAFLSDEEAGQLLKAIYAFVKGDEVPELDRVVQLSFNPIKSHLERDREKYKEICRKRKECGEKGGRPKKQMVIEESKSFSEKAKKADNDNENDNDYDNDNDNDNDNEYENVNDNDILKFGTNIEMTGQQYKQLCREYGQKNTDNCIGMVDRYIPICKSRTIESPYDEVASWLERSRNRRY